MTTNLAGLLMCVGFGLIAYVADQIPTWNKNFKSWWFIHSAIRRARRIIKKENGWPL